MPLHAVQLRDAFWAPRLETNRAVTIPVIWQKCESTGRIAHFERAAAALGASVVAPETPSPWLPFDDSDVYKIIEASCYSLAATPNPQLDAQLDAVIAKIAAAQEPDGYLYTTRTSDPAAPHEWSGGQRWERETDLSHELYDLGHLFEAAVAHQQATGKRSLLQVATRAAELLLATFGPDKRSIWPGHQGIELGLVELYRSTAERRYLELARFFLDQRGPDGKPRSGAEYNQSHAPVLEQTRAVGHAVHATYMYAGMADIAALMDSSAHARALDRIWDDLVAHQLYLTGGVGAQAGHEGFGPPDELENRSAFNETCASVGLAFFCERMFQLHGQARFMDVLELALYNSCLSGVSLAGDSFFYSNPLESLGDQQRSPWFECACCPGNLARLLASLPRYFYAQRGHTVYVNLYGASHARITLDHNRQLELTQETLFPWHGRVRLTVTQKGDWPLSLKLRIPGWARGQLVASDLYSFADPAEEEPTASVNGEAIPIELEAGYLTLNRQWRPGDQIELTLPMPIRRVLAAPRVAANRGCVALTRGPLVYALEGVDNELGELAQLSVPDSSRLAHAFEPDLLGGVVTISNAAHSAGAEAPSARSATFTAIPYFAWANRGRTAMRVWLRRGASSAP